MTSKLIIALLISIPHTYAATCDFAATPEVYSEDKIRDYNEKDELVSFYPKLTDFATYFPDTVKINTTLVGNCSSYKLKLSVYYKEGKKAVHEHSNDGDHKRLEHKDDAKEKAIYLKNPSFENTIDINKGNSQYSFEKVPNLKFYEKLSDKRWYHQVKYDLEIITTKGAVMKRRSIMLDTPMAD